MDVEPHLGALEAAYRRHHLRKDHGSVRLAALAWMVFTLSFIRADYLLFGLRSPFLLLLISKGGYCLLTLLMLLILRRLTQPRHMDWLVCSWSLLSAMFIVGQELSRPRAYLGHYPMDVLIIVSLYVVPNRLPLRLLPALGFTTVALLGLVLNPAPVPHLDRTAIVAAIVLANVLGFVISTRLFTYRREQFRAVMEHQRANEALAALAATDPLTGVLNRRAFYERGDQEYRHFARSQHPFAVQLIDLDWFKQVNDTFGHQAGDETLRQFADLVRRHTRATDVFGRLGGEEFGLLLPNTSLAAAQQFGERLRAITHATPIRLPDREITITLSMGVAEAQREDRDFDALMCRVDRLLYHAKQQGRNRVAARRDGPLDTGEAGVRTAPPAGVPEPVHPAPHREPHHDAL